MAPKAGYLYDVCAERGKFQKKVDNCFDDLHDFDRDRGLKESQADVIFRRSLTAV